MATSMANLRIVIAQQNFPVGDIEGNEQKIIAAIQQARDELQSGMVIFPELALCGYPAEDLLLREDFLMQCEQSLTKICAQTAGIDVILGYPERTDNQLYNAVCVIRDGRIIANYRKQRLPNYGVFDERRYFTSADQTVVFTHKNISFGILICEDLWDPAPIANAADAGAQLIICVNASPFEITKAEQRTAIARARISEQRLPIIYAHRISGQDDLIFDGGSFAMDAQQKICAQGRFFVEELLSFEINPQNLQPIARPLPAPLSMEERVYQALVFSMREYVNRNRFPGVLLGVSGGIDSALALTIAVDALGADKVHAVLLPSRYTSDLSKALADELLNNMGVHYSDISIDAVFQQFLTDLAPDFKNLPPNITEENLQARCRGVFLMALSNKTGKLVLTTGNKSEFAVGYSTLYGDMVGGFAVLKDVYKTLVYRLANYRNAISPQIPQGIIDRPPTAELAPNQLDEDTLPPYSVLDQILALYVDNNRSLAEIVASGFNESIVRRVIKMVHASEYKRRQAPPGPKITARAFGRERRYPITMKN